MTVMTNVIHDEQENTQREGKKAITMLRTLGASLAAAGLSLGMLAAAPGAVGEEPTEAGNKLSYPVLWAEDSQQFAPLPPGAMGTEVFVDVTSGTDPDTSAACDAALQASDTNSWQADNALAVGNPVTHVDWGDNLEAKDWSVGNKVRVETVLFDNALETPMLRYLMCYVSGQGQTESWGAKVTGGAGSSGDVSTDATGYTAVTEESTSAIVYSDGGRLTIQRITDPSSVSWSTSEHRWVGAGAAAPVVNMAVHEKTSDGPGSYGAELNIQGKVVYGFLWDTTGMYNGEYRLTFSLDGAMDGFAGSGTDLNTAVPVVPTEEELEEAREEALEEALTPLAGSPGGEDAANTAVVAGGVTYIDVGLTGGVDAPVDPDDPGDDPTTPPSTGGGSTTPPEPAPVGDSEGPGPQAGQPEDVTAVQAATAPQRQRAKLGMPKSGKKFAPGTVRVLTDKPIKTTAGVTVRWRVTTKSRDYCSVKTLRGTKNPDNRGKTLLRMRERGNCTVVAWAPAPSPEHLQYRKAFTYRIGR